MTADPYSRWEQRFENYCKAFALLEEALQLAGERELSELEKAGFIYRFHMTWELGWKTLSDYLRKHEDPSLLFAPGPSIRMASMAQLIDDSDAWLNAGKLRNALTHEYSLSQRDEGMILIRERFQPIMIALHRRMTELLHAA